MRLLGQGSASSIALPKLPNAGRGKRRNRRSRARVAKIAVNVIFLHRFWHSRSPLRCVPLGTRERPVALSWPVLIPAHGLHLQCGVICSPPTLVETHSAPASSLLLYGLCRGSRRPRPCRCSACGCYKRCWRLRRWTLVWRGSRTPRSIDFLRYALRAQG